MKKERPEDINSEQPTVVLLALVAREFRFLPFCYPLD